MKSFRFLDTIAAADAAFEASGSTLDKLFSACVDATLRVMIENPEDIRPVLRIPVSLEKSSLDMLLFALLGEIVYHKDAGPFLLRAEEIAIAETQNRYSLDAMLIGERIDPARHRMIVDVKAVTLYRLSVGQSEDAWWATVVLDI